MAHRIVRRSTPSLKTWLGQNLPAFGTDVTPAAGTFSPGLKVFGGPGTEDVTILRTRGFLSSASQATTFAPGIQLSIALGIGLCTTEAALAGAVPLPYDNPEWDGWFVYQAIDFVERPDSATVNTNASMIIDSKAMRKVPSGQVLFLSTQLFAASGAGGSTVNEVIQVRQLLKTS